MSEPVLKPCAVPDVLACVNRDGWQGLTTPLVRELLRTGPAWTIWADETRLGCAGVSLAWPGVGQAWMVLTETVNGHGVWLTRTVRQVLADVERAYGLHRLEALAVTDSPRNQDWLEALGFVPEQDGTARAYGAQRQDMRRYERVRGV